MSAYTLSPVQLARADAGVVGFVPKPYCFEELVRFIQDKARLHKDDLKSTRTTDESRKPLSIPVDISALSLAG